MSQEKECKFHSLYTVVPLVTQFLGLDKPSIWKRPVALLSYFGLPLIGSRASLNGILTYRSRRGGS